MGMDAKFTRASTEALWRDHGRRVQDPVLLGVRLNNKAEYLMDAGRHDEAIVYALAGLACVEMDTRRIEAEHKAAVTAGN